MVVTYSIVDVFTRQRFSGNPVAVIHDAGGLDGATMQAIAREFGFSETTFILEPETPDATARVRIFTPFDEIPFAGHPNIGTAFVIASEATVAASRTGRDMRFEELGGIVSVRLIIEAAGVAGAEITAPEPLRRLGSVAPDLMAQCLGVPVQAIRADRWAPCVASVGLPFAFVELASLDSLSAVVSDSAAFRKASTVGPRTVDGFAVCAFVVIGEGDNGMTLRTRVLSPLGHPPEDPATGSASGALGALLSGSRHDRPRRYEILQGVEMGRPSEITVETPGPDQPPVISGHCVPVATGTLHV